MKTFKGFGTAAILGVVAILILLGGAAYMYKHPKAATSEAPAAQKIKEPTISWKFEDAGEKDHIPYTKVILTVNGKTQDAGTYQGSCSEIGASGGVDGKGLLAGELSGVQCWFAGGGDEIGVFANETSGLDLLVGSLSEGVEGGATFRGDFKAKENFQF